MDAIFNRTSIRKYKQESLKKEEIDLILKAAFSAPSARNSQPWQFIVVQNKDTLKDLSQMTPYASFLKDAAMGMVVCADKNKNDSLDYCQQDLAAATENMLVEAKSLGIGSCWLGVYPNEERYLALNQYFKLPKGIVPMWMISFGYIDQEEVVKDKFDSSKVHYEKYCYSSIYLTCNKYNKHSLAVYEKFGFQWIDSVQTDIGNDFIMDDYILEYRLGTFL